MIDFLKPSSHNKGLKNSLSMKYDIGGNVI